jgi:hypothetical protein
MHRLLSACREGARTAAAAGPPQMVSLGACRRAHVPAVPYAELDGDSTHQSYDTPFVFIGNNRYTVAGLDIGTRAALDGSKLWVCTAPYAGRLRLLALAVEAAAGACSRCRSSSVRDRQGRHADASSPFPGRKRPRGERDADAAALSHPARRSPRHGAGGRLMRRSGHMRTIVHLSDLHFGRFDPELPSPLQRR